MSSAKMSVILARSWYVKTTPIFCVCEVVGLCRLQHWRVSTLYHGLLLVCYLRIMGTATVISNSLYGASSVHLTEVSTEKIMQKIGASLRFHKFPSRENSILWTVFLQLNFNVAVSRYFKWYFGPTRKVWKIYIITDNKRFLLKMYINSGIHCSSPPKVILLVWHYCLVQENLMSNLSVSPQHWNLDSYVYITFISTSNTRPAACM